MMVMKMVMKMVIYDDVGDDDNDDSSTTRHAWKASYTPGTTLDVLALNISCNSHTNCMMC